MFGSYIGSSEENARKLDEAIKNLGSTNFPLREQAQKDLTALGRQRRVVLSVNQHFTAGRVITQSDLLTVLPLAFMPATGHEGELQVCELPFDLGPMQVTMLWHMRHDAEPAHRWLRERVQQAAGGQP